MSTLKRRIENLEARLNDPESQYASWEYIEKFLEASEEEQGRMHRPVMTLEMLEEMAGAEGAPARQEEAIRE